MHATLDALALLPPQTPQQTGEKERERGMEARGRVGVGWGGVEWSEGVISSAPGESSCESCEGRIV